MISLHERAVLVLAEAWRLLPPIKQEAWISGIEVRDLGAKHGAYSLDDGLLTLSTRLFWGVDAAEIMYIDQDGNTPPIHENYTSRALHTATHEFSHAIGAATHLDETPEWLELSGWVMSRDNIQGYGRYYERRPGWFPHGPSEWRFKLGTWFPRLYSSKSPMECFSDCVSHYALGWGDFVATANGRAKMRYMARHVWRESTKATLHASVSRWRQSFREKAGSA